MLTEKHKEHGFIPQGRYLFSYDINLLGLSELSKLHGKSTNIITPVLVQTHLLSL